MKLGRVAMLSLFALTSSCSHRAALPLEKRVSAAGRASVDAPSCHARIEALSVNEALPGTPSFDANRIEILGRARGEPMVFVREPQPSSFAPPTPFETNALRAYESGPPGARVERLARALRAEPAVLRAILLREGYVYAPAPLDALELSRLHLRDLASEPALFVHRGTQIREARRVKRRGGDAYVWRGGEDDGRDAELLFGDRIATNEAELVHPLHRDFRELASKLGFDRAKIVRRDETSVVAELRFGTAWVTTLLASEGASLSLACRDASSETLTKVDDWLASEAPRRRSLARLSNAVTDAVNESLRFDRPEGEKTAERDGQLRPVWYAAYLRGAGAFEFDGNSYPTRDAKGDAWPPEVCVDFVLDSFERASGTWFRGAGEPPGRVHGKLDFDAHKIENRRGVLGFEAFAAKTPEMFELRRFEGKERIAFEHRTAFFQFLLDHADELRPGDVLAIQGRKRDGLIHQHAIILETTDPLTGFAYGLADQMKRPRRRTWEGIMAEAPLRALLYRARPTDGVLLASER